MTWNLRVSGYFLDGWYESFTVSHFVSLLFLPFYIPKTDVLQGQNEIGT